MTQCEAVIEEYLEPNDVGRELNLSGSSVRAYSNQGLLRVAARTLRGLRLYRREDVLAFRASRNRRPEHQS